LVATVAKLGFDGCDKCMGLLEWLVGFFHQLCLFLLFSQLICEVMGIHKAKQIKEVRRFPDIISSKILQGNEQYIDTDNQQLFSSYLSKRNTRSQHCLRCAFLDLSF
jgi:hypothetical protein